MRGSSDHPEFVHPALRSEGLASRGRPGPGGLMGGGDGEGKLFYGEEGRQMRKPMEFRVSCLAKKNRFIDHLYYNVTKAIISNT